MRLQDLPAIPSFIGSEQSSARSSASPSQADVKPAAMSWRGWHATSAEDIEVAQQIEHDVFVAEGFTTATPTRHTHEFEKYNQQSRWFLAAHGDKPASGVMRVIVAGKLPLPVAKAFHDEPAVLNAISKTNPAEIGIAVRHGAREGFAAHQLYRQGYKDSMSIGQRYWIAVIEPWYLEALRRMHFPFEQLTEPRWYMGGDCLAALLDIAVVMPLLKALDPTLGAFIRGETETW